MILDRASRAHPDFMQGARDMLGVSPGIAAWGLMTGVAMIKSGMGMAESLLMAAIVFAGSAQLASIPLILAGAPVGVILAKRKGFAVPIGQRPFDASPISAQAERYKPVAPAPKKEA